jgi:AraC-like DNA-binding protein
MAAVDYVAATRRSWCGVYSPLRAQARCLCKEIVVACGKCSPEWGIHSRPSVISIAAITTQVGVDDPAYFSRVFHKETDCSPRQYWEQSFRT